MSYMIEICEFVPGNFEFINEEIRNLIDFNMLKPE